MIDGSGSTEFGALGGPEPHHELCVAAPSWPAVRRDRMEVSSPAHSPTIDQRFVLPASRKGPVKARQMVWSTSGQPINAHSRRDMVKNILKQQHLRHVLDTDWYDDAFEPVQETNLA